MTKQYSIAAAKNQLSKVVHEAEGDGYVELTRRGRPVAVVLSLSEYDRLRGVSIRPVWQAVASFREEYAEELSELAGAFEGLRSDAPGGRPAW